MSATSIRTALKAIFGLQLGIASVLLAQDFLAAAPSISWPGGPSAPATDVPIRPGDQRRLFDPARLPVQPGVELPGDADMPSRLFFDSREDGSVLLTGTIKPGDAKRFAEWWQARATPPERVALHSPGGSVADGLVIGAALRQAGVTTLVEAGAICFSACPYMLMGGEERIVSRKGYVGVHQHYFGENTILPAFLAVEDIQHGQAAVVEFLTTMEIDLRLMKHALGTPPDEIYILVPEELTEYEVATELVD